MRKCAAFCSPDVGNHKFALQNMSNGTLVGGLPGGAYVTFTLGSNSHFSPGIGKRSFPGGASLQYVT